MIHEATYTQLQIGVNRI